MCCARAERACRCCSLSPLQLAGVLLSLCLVDSLGRRPLLLWGSLGCAGALVALAAADWLALRAFLVASMCAFIFAFRCVWGLWARVYVFVCVVVV